MNFKIGSFNGDNYSPEQAIFPNLTPSEELRLLKARIQHLERMEQMEMSSFGSFEMYDGPDEDAEVIGEEFCCLAIDAAQNGENDGQMVDDQQQIKVDQQNWWDANACHSDLQICGPNDLTVHYKGRGYVTRSVFAKYPIRPMNSSVAALSSGVFYYEILVKNMKYRGVIIGFAVKEGAPLDRNILKRDGTYAFTSTGIFYLNNSKKPRNEQFGTGDVVGCGVNLANRQLFFTKNGQRIDSSDLFIYSEPSFDEQVFPSVCLVNFDDKIEANFGPNFKFDLATL